MTLISSLKDSQHSMNSEFQLTENLYSRSWMFRQVCQRSRVSDESSADRFAHQNCEIWCNRHHSSPQIIVQMRTIFVNCQHLVAELTNVDDVFIGNFRSHRHFCCFFDTLLEIERKNVRQLRRCKIFTHANQLDGFDECNIIGENLAEFREVPAVPAEKSRSYQMCANVLNLTVLIFIRSSQETSKIFKKPLMRLVAIIM